MQHLTNFYRNRSELLEKHYQQLLHKYRLLQEDVRTTPPDLGIGSDSPWGTDTGGGFWWDNPLGTGEPPPFPYQPGSLSGERYMNPWWNQGYQTTQTPGGGPVLDVVYDDEDAEDNFAGFTDEQLMAMFGGVVNIEKLRKLFSDWLKRSGGINTPQFRMKFLEEFYEKQQLLFKNFITRMRNGERLSRSEFGQLKGRAFKHEPGAIWPNLPGAKDWPKLIKDGDNYVMDPATGRVYMKVGGIWIDVTGSISPNDLFNMVYNETGGFRLYPGQQGHGGGSSPTWWLQNGNDPLPPNFPYNLPEYENWPSFINPQ